MKKTVYLLLVLSLALSLIVLNINCGNDSRSETNDEKDEIASIPVEISVVEKGNISAYFSGTATLEAEEEAQVVSKVDGVVQKIFVEEGDYVKTGHILAQLDDEKLKLQLAQTEVNLNKMKNDLDRTEELFKKNLISNEQFDKVKYDYELQKANYDLSKLQLDYSAIRASISGVISNRMIKVGNMVNINQQVFQIVDFDPLLAVLHVPERETGKLKVGQQTKLMVDALPGSTFQGIVKRISPVVDPATGTSKITVEIKDPSQNLKSGMFARVNIIYEVRKNTILIPKDAILTEDEESTVFIVREDSLAFRRTVKIGFINTTRLEITDGLNPGDTIITTGLNTLKDSTKVEPVNLDKLFAESSKN